MDPIIVVAQLVFGFAVKRFQFLAAWPNRLIPVFNYVLAVLIGLVQGDAHAGGLGGFFSSGIGAFLLDAGLNTLLATGTHSFGKNFAQHVLRRPVAR